MGTGLVLLLWVTGVTGFRKEPQNLSVVIVTPYQGASYRQDVVLRVLTPIIWLRGVCLRREATFHTVLLRRKSLCSPHLNHRVSGWQVRLLIVEREFTEKQEEGLG